MRIRKAIWLAGAFLLCLSVVTWGALPGRALTQPAAGPAPQALSDVGATWRSGGPYGGSVQALALSPAFAADGLALAGGWRTGRYDVTDGYGIARTTDGGGSWQLLQDEQHAVAVFDLAISPNFAVDGTAFAGTEMGLTRSTDRGDTWTRLYGGLPDSTAHDPRGIDDIARVILSPGFATDRIMFALQRDGKLYRSANGGDNWTPVLDGGVVFAAAFARHFSDNQTAFAAQFDGRSASNIMRSTDGGQTWEFVQALSGVQVNAILQTSDDALLLATTSGVLRLIPAPPGYIEDPITPNVGAEVTRLAVAGDNVYAASQNGLFISLSFGRSWQRVTGTPETSFRAIAPCPLWGSCHAVMAGTYTGLLFTPDDNWQPWRGLPGPHPLAANSVAASPAYVADGTLYTSTNHGVFRSTDRGLSWQLATAGSAPGDSYTFPAVRLSTSYATDGTVFATYENQTGASAALYKSTDRGQTWTKIGGAGGRALALSPAYNTDHTVFLAGSDVLHKSTDGGVTWQAYPLAPPEEGFFVYDLKVSSAYALDHTLFATGFGRVRRSTDGGLTWTALSTMSPSYGLALSPSYAADGTLWHTFRAIEGPGDGTPESGVRRSTDRGLTWTWATAGLPGVYEPFPIPLAVSPSYTADRTLFTALSGQFVAGNSHSLYRSMNGGDSWLDLGPAPGNPNPSDLAATTNPGGGLTAHLATAAGVWHYATTCEERLVNGGFESDLAWQLPATAYPAGYSTALWRTGLRSLRTGIVSGPDVYSYSSGNQAVTIPAGVASATWTFWWYPISAEGSVGGSVGDRPELGAAGAGLLTVPSLDTLQGVADGTLPAGVLAGDWQYALVLDEYGVVIPGSPRLWTRSDARAWQHTSLDLTPYRGRTIYVVFGTLNDGNGLTSAMYVDDASLTACWPVPPEPSPTPTLTRTPSPTPTHGPVRPWAYLPLVLNRYAGPTPPAATATPTASRTPTRTSSPTATPSPTSTATLTPTATVPPGFLHPRWLRSLVIAPGEAGRLIGLSNEGLLLSSADYGATWTYLPLPAQIAGLPLSYRGFIGMDYNHPETLYLGATSEGLWRSTDGGLTWQQRHPLHIGPISVGLDNADKLWAGLIGTNDLHTVFALSDDAGLTWASTTGEVSDDPASPILIDPQATNVVYAATFGRRGGITLSRTFDGIWQGFPNTPLGWSYGGPALGLALDASTRGLYIGHTDGTLYVSYNAYTPNIADVLWQPVHRFEPALWPIPLAIGAAPQPVQAQAGGGAIYLTLYDPSGQGRTGRSDDGGLTWTWLTIPPADGVLPTPTPTATPTPTPTPTSTPGPTCTDAMVNGGFETDAGWIIRPNPALAAYVTDSAHSGARSIRTGIAIGDANVESYSPVEQAVTFGAVASAQLTFWRSNFYDDGLTNAIESGGDMAGAGMVLPATEAALSQAAFPSDFFYLIAIHDDGAIDWLWREAVNWPEWRALTLDVSRYAGEHIRFQFGTYNNGTIGASYTYVDDVTLRICSSAGSLMRRVFGQPTMNTIYADVGGRLYRSDDAGDTWQASGVALPEHTILSADANTLYAGDGYPCYKGGDPAPLWRTTNGGRTWYQQINGVNLKPLVAHATIAWLYAAGCNGPYLSGDGAQTFWHQPDPLFSVYDVHSIAPVGAWWTEIWVGGISEGGGGAVLVSRDVGASWQQSTPLYLDMGWLGEVTLDRYTPGRVYAPAYNGFFYTPDNGLTWLNDSQGLENVIGGIRPSGLYALAQDPVDPAHRLYLGTRRGLYTRVPGTGAWRQIVGQPFDQLQIDDLLILDSAPYRLYVTTSDGVFLYDLRSLPPPPTPTATPPTPATPTPTRSATASPTGTPTPTATPPTPTRSATASPTGTPTPTRTPSPSPTPTATTTSQPIPTAAAQSWPTPSVLGTIGLPAGSHPHGIALSAAGDAAYVAFHGDDHAGHVVGVLNTAALSLTAQIELAPGGIGPNGVALAGSPAKVLVANRQTDNLAIVDPGPGTVYRWLPAGDMPDGVAVGGNFGYVANFGNDTVTVFDAVGFTVTGELYVGHEPALFATDPTTGDVYLSLHGANAVARLHDGMVAGQINDIATPYGLAFDPASRRLYAANRGSAHTVTVVDMAAGSVLGTIAIGKEPYVLAVNPDSGHLFVVCGDEVKVYRTLDWAPVTSIPVPAGAEEGIAVDSARDRVYVTSGEGDAVTVIQDTAAPEVLFVSSRDGNGEIYRMLPDGREQRRLTRTAAWENMPAGSPDGRWIAYERTDEGGTSHLWLMSRDGLDARQLTTGAATDLHPTWSPDGLWLAFASDRADNWEIYRLRLADGYLERLTYHTAADQNPAWSWATGRIFFQSSRSSPNGEIFSMAGDGSDVRRLTVNPNGDAQPSPSPTGDRVVFWGTRAEQTLYVLMPDGVTILPLVSRSLRPYSPAWGPTSAGSSIVFAGYRPGSGYSEIFRVAPDGSGLALLTFNEVDWDYAPGWLPAP